jgi:hypothetical protein
VVTSAYALPSSEAASAPASAAAAATIIHNAVAAAVAIEGVAHKLVEDAKRNAVALAQALKEENQQDQEAEVVILVVAVMFAAHI